MNLPNAEAMFREIGQNFPKRCSCGTVYPNEATYNDHTHEINGVTIVADKLYFFRNCKQCESTLALSVSKEAFGIQELEAQAGHQETQLIDAINQRREAYNRRIQNR